MKKIFLALSILMFTGSVHAADTVQDLADRTQEAAQVLRQSAHIPDRAIPQSLLAKATCVATFPDVLRAGFVFGGRFGQGLVSCRVGTGWSSPAYMTLVGGSWGLQIGIDTTDLILVFMNPDAIQTVTKDKLELGAGAAVSAGPLGRDAALGTDFTLESEILAYSRTQGLYAGLTIHGSVLDVDKDANALIYGSSAAPAAILQAKYDTAPSTVWPYVQALMDYAP